MCSAHDLFCVEQSCPLVSAGPNSLTRGTGVAGPSHRSLELPELQASHTGDFLQPDPSPLPRGKAWGVVVQMPSPPGSTRTPCSPLQRTGHDSVANEEGADALLSERDCTHSVHHEFLLREHLENNEMRKELNCEGMLASFKQTGSGLGLFT